MTPKKQLSKISTEFVSCEPMPCLLYGEVGVFRRTLFNRRYLSFYRHDLPSVRGRAEKFVSGSTWL
jgi:hypothetical protein